MRILAFKIEPVVYQDCVRVHSGVARPSQAAVIDAEQLLFEFGDLVVALDAVETRLGGPEFAVEEIL